MQARHERCFQELKDLEKQLALLEEHNKMNKLRRDFKAAEYRPAEKHASQVSTHVVICFIVVVICICICIYLPLVP